LWLTSMPSPNFPVSILQNGIKITNEPPKGIKANLLQTYRGVDQEYLDTSKKVTEHQKLLFSLAMFHAVVLERKKFGSLGYNRNYDFTESDLSISMRQLKIFIDLYAEESNLPIKALRYLVGQLNYGGRVTDDWDRRTITHLLEDFFTEKVVRDDYRFDATGKYYAPGASADLIETRNYIQDLPAHDDAEVFGLHENANTTTAIKESLAMFETLLALQPRSSTAGGQSREATIDALARDIESQLPLDFDIEAARRRYPVAYAESMNTVLVQELVRFNKLTSAVKQSLAAIQKAVKGEIVMSSELEAMGDSMFNGQVPRLWSVVAYPSLKPLGAWVQDLKKRLKLFSDWLLHGAPSVFWISGFFFTQSFLTGTLQNYARQNSIAIDEISFDFEVLSHIPATGGAEVTPPATGVYVHGLFLEGARWDTAAGVLAEPLKRQLHCEMPVIHLRPCETKKIPTNRLTYTAPVYKTSTRAGTLSTTGHSVSASERDNPCDVARCCRALRLLRTSCSHLVFFRFVFVRSDQLRLGDPAQVDSAREALGETRLRSAHPARFLSGEKPSCQVRACSASPSNRSEAAT
jgi:dynein heavy chain